MFGNVSAIALFGFANSLRCGTQRSLFILVVLKPLLAWRAQITRAHSALNSGCTGQSKIIKGTMQK